MTPTRKTTRGSNKITPAKKARTAKNARARTSMLTFPGRAPLPPKMYCTLRYCDQQTITLALGGFQQYIYKANSCFDPNTSGGALQPLYFDQMMALYNHGHVRASRITINMAVANDLQTAIAAQLVVDDNTSLGTNSVTHMTAMPGQQKPLIVRNTADGPYPTLSASYKATDVWGGNLLSNNALRFNATGDCTELTQYIFGVQDYNANNITVVIATTIEYDVVFTEFKSVADS